ncbi:MAG: c-type cytochrome [Gemmatimonadota bacterium]|nr:c-type cytochrome [Gemmatimonadota bacterium]
MIWLKRLAFLAGGLVVLIVLAAATTYVIVGLRIGKRYDVAAVPIAVPTDSAAIAAGQHLVTAIGKCTLCHGEDLGGKVMGDDFAFGRLVAPNLTAGNGGVLGRDDNATIARAIREGVRRDGTPLIFMPSNLYHPMSDADVGAIIAYLRSRPRVDRALPGSRIGPVARAVSLFTEFPLIPARDIDRSVTPPREVPVEASAHYGKYLMQIGLCTGCHRPNLSGGSGPNGRSSNLTPAGIGSWTEADFTHALREGRRLVGAPLDSAVMPWPLAGKMTDFELHAVWLYLKSLPPQTYGTR